MAWHGIPHGHGGGCPARRNRGSHLVRQRALTSAQRIIAANAAGQRQVALAGGTPSSETSAERLLLARGGRLAGRPDRFDGRVLTEYKSSIPAPAMPRPAMPWRHSLASISRLAAGVPVSALSQPGEQACTACPFQALCPSFWPRLAASGSTGLPEAAAAGVLDRIEPSLDGDLYTAYLSVHQPAVPPGIQPLVLRRSIHGDLTAWSAGATWRIVSAKLKSDGRLRADPSTCVFAVDGLPSVVTADAHLDAVQRS